jgi:hypothetical protein
LRISQAVIETSDLVNEMIEMAIWKSVIVIQATGIAIEPGCLVI